MLNAKEKKKGTPMVMYDFFCPNCEKTFDDIVETGTANLQCPVCGELAERVWLKTAQTITAFVPVYPGSRARTAGGCEDANRPATKIMSGPAGCTTPKPKTIFAPE